METTTSPHTIAEAVDFFHCHRRRSFRRCRSRRDGQQQSQPSDAAAAAAADGSRFQPTSAVDLVVVVDDVDVRDDDFGSATVVVWICDGSLSSDSSSSSVAAADNNRASCSITFRRQRRTPKACSDADDGSTGAIDLVVGDVVRFNGVKLRDDCGDIEEKGQLLPRHNHRTTFHRFYHDPWSKEYAGPGPEWAKLCHIDCSGEVVDTRPQDSLPGSVRTDPAVVRRLVDWYRQSKALEDRNRAVPALSQPHCRRRSIVELQTAVGVTSHVVANVVDVREVPQLQFAAAAAMTTGKKRKRNRPADARRRPRPNNPTYAALTDHSEHAIAFVDGESRFRSILLEARKSGRPVRLSCVRSRRGGGDGGADEDVTLVATNETTATLLPKGSEVTSGCDSIQQGEEDDCSQMVASQILPPSVGNATQAHRHFLRRAISARCPLQIVFASIQSISVDGLILSNEELQPVSPSPSDTCDAATARIVRMLSSLADNDAGSPPISIMLLQQQQQPILVGANTNILRTLCGGLTSVDLASEEFCRHSERVLSTLVKDEVKLRWTVASAAPSTDGPLRGHEALPQFEAVQVALPSSTSL